ncbi:bifunctional folylpolyglutamate synthase/dihydrofolate synthase [Sphingopyxis sp. H050]|uniref:bifunctional folylpolyglutamate synthase/dihydrofolate synthase n=1 Tax=Sphingopyxis sp. H050 TaxID=1759072 RepID=UPI00073714B0|nr:folylpolyglutamate synthase/dihydrofolate synthase family protein [Sphingopyxis sp. H050]KTE22040.1 bifunctional folylpolyglutamate synthase/dihydrofolate synthase [Sphingopyxis sp. H050]
MPDHAHSSDPAVQAQLDRLAALSPGRDILGLERIAELCNRLGNPQNRLPRTFHVAGTNGKGSTCAYLRAILEASGRRVHAYTSPHLVRFNERIRLAGTLIDDALLAALLKEVLDRAEGLQASFFEVTTAAAFLAFARTLADDCIIEVGLGGRLDATNIISPPAVCGIASLGIDHEAFLLAPEPGAPADPATRIAWEKAGIIKPGTRLACLDYPLPLANIIGKTAAAADVMPFAENDAWAVVPDGEQFFWRSKFGSIVHPLHSSMPGAHQRRNAGLAIAMLRLADGPRPSDDAIARGVASAFWPGRMQRLGPGPLTALLPAGADLWLDGGHNPDAGAALARALDDRAPLHIVCGLLANKDAMGFLRPFASRIASFQAVPIPGHEHHDPNALCRRVQSDLGIADAQPCGDVTAALRHIADLCGDGDVLICGSLYLAGIVLDLNGEHPV